MMELNHQPIAPDSIDVWRSSRTSLEAHGANRGTFNDTTEEDDNISNSRRFMFDDAREALRSSYNDINTREHSYLLSSGVDRERSSAFCDEREMTRLDLSRDVTRPPYIDTTHLNAHSNPYQPHVHPSESQAYRAPHSVKQERTAEHSATIRGFDYDGMHTASSCLDPSRQDTCPVNHSYSTSAAHFPDNHVIANLVPGPHHHHHHSAATIWPTAMNVNVSMSMNVHGLPVPPHSYYTDPAPQTDVVPWGSRQSQPHANFHHHTPPVAAVSGDFIGSTNSSYPNYHQNYPPTTHGYGAFFDSDVPRLGASLVGDSIYKPSSSAESASRLYSLGSLPPRRHIDRLGSPLDISGKVNLCRICGKTYARPSTLKTHMRTHSGEKPYKCNTCTKSFSQAANLTAHIRTHSGEKPFRCPLCDRKFSQSSSVTTHMRTHSGERPYRCRLCKKAFSDSSTLTKHLRIHSGEKPYQCKLCLLRFSQSGNLNRHMRVHTGNNV